MSVVVNHPMLQKQGHDPIIKQVTRPVAFSKNFTLPFCRLPCQLNQLLRLSQGRREPQMQMPLVEFYKQELTTCTLHMTNIIRRHDCGCLVTMR